MITEVAVDANVYVWLSCSWKKVYWCRWLCRSEINIKYFNELTSTSKKRLFKNVLYIFFYLSLQISLRGVSPLLDND